MNDAKDWYLYCDNAGKNVDFERFCNEEKMGMELICTSPDTSQQNGFVEWKFTTYWAKLANQGTPGSRVGFAESHSASTYST